jgi:Rod binding domain-containing protein
MSNLDPLGTLPAVPDTALPADVRTGGAKDKQTYQAALAFERQLLDQLLQSMTADTQDGSSDDTSDDGSGGSVMDTADAATNVYKQQLPEQLADAVINGGGTGMAENLYRALRQDRS